MSKSFFVFFFLIASLASRAQPAPLIADYQHLVRSHETRIRTELHITDPLFFTLIDTLAKYCTDRRFTAAQQIQNLQGLTRFLSKVDDREQIRSGKCANLLLFYFSVIDWRREGSFYENLNSYSSFAMRCASFFSEDSMGMSFIARQAESNPDEIMISADQLSDNIRYRSLIEDAIVRDPDFAKRYFFADNTVSYYAANSKRKEVKAIYDLFTKYGTKTKAYILYDAVRKNQLTPEQADSVGRDNKAMIRELVKILNRPDPAGIRSVLREMDYRSTDWIRQSSRLTLIAAGMQFNKFSPDEKLAILTFGYRECNPQLLDLYLSVLQKSDLYAIAPALLDNLGSSPLPAFLHSLEKDDKLSGLLSSFNEASKEKLSQMLASDESDNGQPLSLESLSKNRRWSDEAEPESSQARSDISDISAISRREAANIPPAAEPDPYDDIVAEPVHIQLSDSSRGILGLKRNIYMALQDISSFIHKPYAKDLLTYAAAVEPDEVFKKVDMYKTKYWCRDILEEATLNAPLYAKRYLNNVNHPVTVILGYSKDSVIMKFLALSREAKFQSRPFLLFDEMVNNCLTLEDAIVICRDNKALFRELMSIAAQKNYIGRFNVETEMNYYALRYIRGINDKADLPESERYASVEGLNCNELYYLMVYGREEVFDNTFQGLFTRFESKCMSSGYWSAQRFIALPHYRSFIAMCAAYNKLDKFLSLFSAADQRLILSTFASSLDRERDELSDAATVAETVANTSSSSVMQVIQNTIKASYQHLDSIHDYNGMAIYGILSALLKDKAVSDRRWFAVMAKKYKVGTLTTLSNAALMDKKVFVERMYFYNDEDGRDSYKNFIASYASAPGWKVDQYFSYVRVSSTSGNRVEIYANKAELEESGDREISKIFKDNNYTVKGIVHRGHSFHTDATLMRVPATARFIFVGSCGGFYKINIALRKAPDAHVISTRQIGIKQLNDPIIFNFNEYVRQGRDINWRTFWDDMKDKLGSNSLFNDYVPPHKNLESLFVRAYYQIMGNE